MNTLIETWLAQQEDELKKDSKYDGGRAAQLAYKYDRVVVELNRYEYGLLIPETPSEEKR